MTAPSTEHGDGFSLGWGKKGADGPGIGLERLTDAAVAAVRRYDIRRVSIGSPWPDDTLDALVAAVPKIRILGLGEARLRSLAAIEKLDDLEKLSLSASGAAPDYARLGKLRDVLLGAPAELGNLGDAPNLEALALFDVRLPSLAKLANARRLTRLYLNSLKGFKSLDGIEELPLQSLRIVRAQSLRSLAPLRAVRTLHEIEIDYARNIGDIEVLGELPSLVKIAIGGGPAVRSLDFVRGLPNLETLMLSGEGSGAPLSLTPVRHLHRLQALAIEGLAKARVEVVDLEALATVTSLEHLAIIFGPRTIRSIAWVEGLKALRKFGLHETVLEDGKLGPLRALPHLTTASFKPYPEHYDISQPELKAMLAARRPL